MGRRGFDVETEINADAGLERIRAESFDLAAIDHAMPGKDGLAMLREIVEMKSYPPVVFVTGTDEPEIAIEALTSGATDFVIKTVGDQFFDLLAGRLRSALDRVALERAKLTAETDLRAANERLEMLVREIHHRVSNSLQMVLSFVAMQANQTSDASAREALAATQNRIRAISKVHHRLYTRDDLSTIDLDEYLRNLVSDLGDSLSQGEERIEVTLRADPVEVPPDSAVAIGVIVNELVSNAAKYAYAPGQGGMVEVSLRAKDEGGYALSVSDNGKGIASSNVPQGTGLGMRIINAVARKLDTQVDQVPVSMGTCHRFVVQPQGS